MIKSLIYMDSLEEEEENVYKKIAKIRNKFLKLQKTYFELIEDVKAETDVAQELLDLIYECTATLKQMSSDEVVELEKEVYTHRMKAMLKKEKFNITKELRRGI
ncbi:MAG: hypothetical protein ACRC6U_09085 [Fusobacteriaceae bacterium]